ncbi:MAG TPA: hypothetical protein VG960_13410, partial [Caulobacteraceae bacterium]|nr:hypothetical protein [Caulobacteraceae bacterium]
AAPLPGAIDPVDVTSMLPAVDVCSGVVDADDTDVCAKAAPCTAKANSGAVEAAARNRNRRPERRGRWTRSSARGVRSTIGIGS